MEALLSFYLEHFMSSTHLYAADVVPHDRCFVAVDTTPSAARRRLVNRAQPVSGATVLHVAVTSHYVHVRVLSHLPSIDSASSLCGRGVRCRCRTVLSAGNDVSCWLHRVRCGQRQLSRWRIRHPRDMPGLVDGMVRHCWCGRLRLVHAVLPQRGVMGQGRL